LSEAETQEELEELAQPEAEAGPLLVLTEPVRDTEWVAEPEMRAEEEAQKELKADSVAGVLPEAEAEAQRL
jgi:hypothetical protein